MTTLQRLKFALLRRLYYWLEDRRRFEKRLVKEQLQASLKKFGEGSRLNGRIEIQFPQNVEIHENVHIGDNAFINGRGGVKILPNTHVGRNLVIYSSNHNFEGDVLPYDNTHTLKPVIVGKNVWLGTNVVIIPGITIGNGAIVGAGTVVNQDIPPLAIVGSAPIKIIRFRNEDHYNNLEVHKLYGGANGKPQRGSNP